MDIQTYFIIGILFTALIDYGIYYLKSSKQFTLLEIWSCTMLWPIMMALAVYFIIRESNK